MNVKKVTLFVGLTLLLSYLLVALYFILGGTWTIPGSTIIGVILMFVPATVAVFIQKRMDGRSVKEQFGISFRPNRWLLVAWLLPLAMVPATIGVSLLLPSVEFSWELETMYQRLGALLSPEQLAKVREQVSDLPLHPFWLGLLQALVAGPTINALVASGEELGWRGFLHRELTPLGFWKASATTGLIWGIWHAPIILQGHNYPQHPKIGAFMMTLTCLLLSPLFSYIRIRADSVTAAAVIHGSFNAFGGLALVPLRGGGDLIIGFTGFAGLLVLALANTGLWIGGRQSISNWEKQNQKSA